MKTMKSIVFTGKDSMTGKSTVEIQEFDIPVCEPDKLLVHVQMCGLCTYEQRVYSGVHNVQYPFVGGHEVAGEIVAVGKEVAEKSNEWHVGDKVVVGVTLPCRSCKECKCGEEQSCESFDEPKRLPGQPYLGSGGLSEYMMQNPECVFKYYDVDAAEACLTEPLSCVLHSVETADPQFGDTAVIVGAGIMGMLHLELCLRKGTNTIVIDMNEERLAFAKEVGANHVINPNKVNAAAEIEKITRGHKADVVFDTTPIAKVVEQCCDYIGKHGTLIVYSGIYPNEPISLNPHWIHKNSIRILGTANSNDRDFMRASALISNGIIDVKKYISGVYPAEEVENALASACKGDKFRNIIQFY